MKFDKTQFVWDGMYLMYREAGESRFVARFKMKGERTKFVGFLIKNFTVEEYFQLIAAKVAPLNILETKGYVSAVVAKILKTAGYPVTQAGKNAYLKDQAVLRSERWAKSMRA